MRTIHRIHDWAAKWIELWRVYSPYGHDPLPVPNAADTLRSPDDPLYLAPRTN